jgi:5-methylcytosine-specific restriction endonuclease McrA
MATFDKKSRYVLNATTYVTTDRRGRTVTVLTPAERPAQVQLGDHRRKDVQRLDHLANFYLQDPFGFWRLAEHNDAVLPDALADVDIVRIPRKA